MEEDRGKNMDKMVGKDMDEVVGCKKGSASIGGIWEEEDIVARAKGFLSCNGVDDDTAGKKTGIARCEGEPGEDFASAELPLEKFASAELPVKKEGKSLTLQEQMMILRKEQCRLLKEREERVRKGETSASDGSKLADARARLERAKHNREQLGLHYARKEALAAEQGATLEVYRQLKDEYFGFVRQAGELDLQLKEMEEDLNSRHNALGRMERELWAAEDKNGPRRKAANPWQVGVPYGSGRSGR